VTVQIDSPGGDPFCGAAIYNLLTAYPAEVTTACLGLAASAASIIFMAGDKRQIASNAFLMVHQAWGVTVGPMEDHAETAALLGQIDEALASTYCDCTDLSSAEALDLMRAETWMRGQAAIDAGFATELLPTEVQPTAHWDLSIYGHVPHELKASPTRAPTMFGSRIELERDLREKLRMSQAAAKKVAAAGWPSLTGTGVIDHSHTLNAFSARIDAAKAELAAARRN
jgi:hypothetical protein